MQSKLFARPASEILIENQHFTHRMNNTLILHKDIWDATKLDDMLLMVFTVAGGLNQDDFIGEFKKINK